MFGDLFDEKKASVVMTSVNTSSIAVTCPPLPRHPCGLSGIDNPGSTCYLNSLLETLLFTPEFREGLFSLSENELGSIEDKTSKVRIIPLQLQRLFVRLLLVNQQAASTSELTDSFRWTEEEKCQQHDVQELNKTLFSAIESSLRGTIGSNLIKKLYHGSTVTEVICQSCGKISEKEEEFLDLNVVVSTFNSLQDSLNATFCQKETMKGKNQYRCSTCCNLVDAKKGIKIRCLPPILTLSLVRFAYDIGKGERFKECGRLTFPMEIDMSLYCDKPLDPEDSTYELFSVLIHSGSCYGGHYHAYIRDVDCLGNWSSPAAEPSVNPSMASTWDEWEDPVALIKYLLLHQEDHFCSIETLCREISKLTGSSWNKSYKREHGALCKFLQKHSDLFHLNSVTSIVYLTENDTSAAENLVAEAVSSEAVSSTMSTAQEESQGSPKGTKKSTTKNPLKLNFFDKKKLRNTYDETEQNWFDFNDSRVLPICMKDIEKQYGGKESAYMLFFRAKSLKRPPEAKKNPSYMIPGRYIEFAELENANLNEQREYYQIAMNMIRVYIYFSNNYSYVNGAFQPNSENVIQIEVSIDKRKSLSDLKQQISEASATELTSNLCLYIAQDLPAGVHLYEKLNPSLDKQSLSEIGVLEGTKIFVCDSTQMIGSDIFVGAAYEPVLIHVSASSPSGEVVELSRGFCKSATMHDLKLIMSNIWGLSVDDILMNKLEQHGSCTRLLPILESQLGQSLQDLGFCDGDNLILESASSRKEKMACDEEIHTIVAMVESISNCSNGEIEKSAVIELEVHSETTVAELKALILSRLFADMRKGYILRKYSEGPPLHESLSIKSCGLIEMNTVIIEEGIQPTENEITLKLSIKANTEDQSNLERNFDRTCTVQQCLKTVTTEAGLKGDNWYLQMVSWCGEPLEVLYSDTSSLEDEGLHHGDILLVRQGGVLQKGFLNFVIWLYPTYRNLLAPMSSMNGILEDYETLYRAFLNVAEREFDFVKLGEVELSGDSSVADLKKQILTLPFFLRVSLPSVRFLRLRLIDSNRPGKVLRGLTETLKKLKLNSHPSLCVQLLPCEEDLTQNHILLHVSRRISESKTYETPLEITWDTTKSAGSKALRQIISEKIGIPMPRLIIAKHFSDKFVWQVIEESSSQKKANKNRWSGKKQNLRYAPYFLRDGDTIGVKDQMMDELDMDDFNTQEDLEMQEILRIAGEGKRLKRQSRNANGCGDLMLGGSDCESSKALNRSEVGITIHVDDFI